MSFSILQTVKKILINQWRGEYPALPTILFTMLALRLMIGFIPFIDNIVATSFIVLISVLVLVWQLVGTWRCIERHLKETGETMIYWAGYSVIAIAVVLTMLHTIDLLVGPPPKITSESLRKKPLPSLSEDGSTVYLKGTFDFDLNSDLLTLIKRHKEITTVELESSGGLIYAARALAFSIIKNELNTHVVGECNSACTIAYMAGKTRTLGIQGKIGFHQYELKNPHPLQVKQAQDEQDTDRKYFASRGLSKAILDRVYQSGHQDIWQPKRAELIDSGVITNP